MGKQTTRVNIDDELGSTIGPATEAKQDDIIAAINALSIGGGGTQYTEGDTDATITGTAFMWEDAANTLVSVSSTKPLPVSASIDTTGLATSAKQLADNHNVTVSNHPSEFPLPAAQITTLTPPAAITGFATSAKQLADNHNVTVSNFPASQAVTGTFYQATQPVSIAATVTVDLGANNDVTLATLPDTAGGSLAAMTTDLAAIEVLLTTIEGNQLADSHNVTIDNASIAVTGTFWQATQPVSLATVPSHEVTNAGTFAVQSAITPLTSCGSGVTTVTTAGTQVALGSSTAIDSVTIKALSTNTGLIYVGTSTVSSADGFQLSAGDSVSLDVDNLTDVYVDSAVDTEGVSYLYIT
jgi:hypothetical protein